MKQLVLLAGILVFLTISCEKNGENVYSQEKLCGIWEATGRISNGCVDQLLISSTSLYEIKNCGAFQMKFQAEAYSFDGRIISYKLYGLDMEFEISELTEQKLVLGYNDPLEYKRISY